MKHRYFLLYIIIICCSFSASVAAPTPVANFSFSNACYGDTIYFENLSFISDDTPLSYQWDFGDGNTSTEASPKHRYDLSGIYEVMLIATSNQNEKDSIVRIVKVHELPQIKVNNDTTIDLGTTIQLLATGAKSYEWSPNTGLDDSTSATPLAKPAETTTYTVIGTDERGCVNSNTVTITIAKTYLLVPYNLLTPDGNGKNDTWIVENIEYYADNRVWIYNRWGKEVFYTENYQNDWDGISNRDILPDGTYYYIIGFSGSSKKYKGVLTILRNRP